MAEAALKPADAPKPATTPTPVAVAPATGAASVEPHTALATQEAPKRARAAPSAATLSFLAGVIAPSLIVAFYLFALAAPQYSSKVAFSVRTLEQSAAANILGMLAPTSGAGAEDGLILFDYLHSQQFVDRLDGEIDLDAIYNREGADWFFALGTERPIEDKTRYWNYASTITYDNASRVIEVEVYAFSAQDAQRIAAAVSQESERLINQISEQARQDAVRFAELDMRDAEERLRAVRLRMAEFRKTAQEIDPNTNAELQMQLVASIETELASARAQETTLLTYLGPNAPTVRVVRRRIESLEAQAAAERAKLAGGGDSDPAEATISQRLGVFEELTVDLEFAANLYTASLSALTQAQTEARRSQRYLATHIAPTNAEQSEYPSRSMLIIAVFVSLALLWAVLRLISFSVASRA
ncbi:MAG: sugar transporter [Pseudomonadota bacterium]